jgi:hypothetical protein
MLHFLFFCGNINDLLPGTTVRSWVLWCMGSHFVILLSVMIGYFLVNASSIGSSDQTIFQNLVWLFSSYSLYMFDVTSSHGRVSAARRRHIGSKLLHIDLFIWFVYYITKLHQLHWLLRLDIGGTILCLFSVGDSFESVYFRVSSGRCLDSRPAFK